MLLAKLACQQPERAKKTPGMHARADAFRQHAILRRHAQLLHGSALAARARHVATVLLVGERHVDGDARGAGDADLRVAECDLELLRPTRKQRVGARDRLQRAPAARIIRAAHQSVRRARVRVHVAGNCATALRAQISIERVGAGIVVQVVGAQLFGMHNVHNLVSQLVQHMRAVAARSLGQKLGACPDFEHGLGLVVRDKPEHLHGKRTYTVVGVRELDQRIGDEEKRGRRRIVRVQHGESREARVLRPVVGGFENAHLLKVRRHEAL